MSDEKKSIQRNKAILTFAIIFYLILIILIIVFNSSLSNNIYFNYIKNQNTNKETGLLTSVFLYLLLIWLVGTLLFANVFLFMLLVYGFLHRKDKLLLHRFYFPKYEEEMFHGGKVAMILSYIVSLLFITLISLNIIHLNIF